MFSEYLLVGCGRKQPWSDFMAKIWSHVFLN